MTVKVNSQKALQKLKNLSDIKGSVMPKALETFKKNTPVKSGNARSHTRLDTNKVIQANYGYAQKLDKGASKQAPQGMVKPTEKELEKLVKDYIKRLGAHNGRY